MYFSPNHQIIETLYGKSLFWQVNSDCYFDSYCDCYFDSYIGLNLKKKINFFKKYSLSLTNFFSPECEIYSPSQKGFISFRLPSFFFEDSHSYRNHEVNEKEMTWVIS